MKSSRVLASEACASSVTLEEFARSLRLFLQRQKALGLLGADVRLDWASSLKHAQDASANLPANKATTSPHISRPSSFLPPANESPLSWTELHGQMKACVACRLSEGRTGAVMGRGTQTAEVMFLSEAPSRDDDLQGHSFVGDAGVLLERMARAMGLSPEQVYVGHTVACRPPRNRPASEDELASCRQFLTKQLHLVKPRIIVALGEGATRALFASSKPLEALRGTWTTFLGFRVLSTYHPQMLINVPDKKKLAWLDLQAVMAQLAADTRTSEVQT